MKANEAPKSKFVYPDKLYARTNNNITIDISYAPQTLEAVEYTRTDAFIEKAYEFLDGCIPDYIDLEYVNADTFMHVDNKRFIEDFRNYMKGE